MTASAARQYFAGCGALFDDAAEACSRYDRCYTIAGRQVVVRTAGAELTTCTAPALAQPSTQQFDTTASDLVVDMWDSATSAVPIGQAPWEPDDLGPLGLVRTYCDDRFLSAVDVHTASLSLFDRATSHGRFWLEDARRMAYWQSASPLRLILSWWAASRRMQRRSSDIVRLALREFLGGSRRLPGRPIDRVRGLIGSLESGIPDLAARDRDYVRGSLTRG